VRCASGAGAPRVSVPGIKTRLECDLERFRYARCGGRRGLVVTVEPKRPNHRHSERSEESRSDGEMLRLAQDDVRE